MPALIVVALIVVLILALVGAPLFAVFGAASMLLFTGEGGTITSSAVKVFSAQFSDSPTLVTLPLFTFAGYVLAESGTPQRLVRVSRALFGWLPGSLAIVCLLASAFFTTFTGGSGITIVAVGGLLFPALLSERYPEKFSLGLVTTGGSLGLLFPPSIPIVLYAVISEILIDKLFLAGIIPGTILMVILAAYASFIGLTQRPSATDDTDRRENLGQFLRFVGGAVGVGLPILLVGAFTGVLVYTLLPGLVIGYLGGAFAAQGETRAALLEASWEVVLPVLLMVGLLTGVLRIHEAAAFTALYVLVIEVFVYRDLTLREDLPRVVRESMTMLGAILAILATALGFTEYLIDARVPENIVIWMRQYISAEWQFLIALNLFLLVVGMLMDIFSAIVVVVPLIVPIALAFGVDKYHLGIIFLLNLEIGYLTPPVGLNLFISSFRFRRPVTELYRAVLPFIGLLVLALIITTWFEPLSTWLPSFVETEEISLEEIEGPEMGGGDLLDDDGGLETLDDLGGESLDDLTLDDLDGETLDDLDFGGEELETLDDLDFGGEELETLDDLDFGGEELETLEDLEAPSSEGETLEDLAGE